MRGGQWKVDMEKFLTLVITIVCSVFASSGFWAFMQKKTDVKDVTREMLIGLGHDRIIYLGLCYIERGWLTREEYENVHKYLYTPYKRMGGNGTVDRLMKQVDDLPIRAVSVVDLVKDKNEGVCPTSQK
jgi:hypothetical protein